MPGELVLMGDLNALEGSTTLDLAHRLIPGGLRSALFSVGDDQTSYADRVAVVERCRAIAQRLKEHAEGTGGLTEVEVLELSAWQDRQRQWGTLHDYAGTTAPYRIDYILVSPGLQVIEAAILDTAPGGIWGSDHHPVHARVLLAE